MSSIQATGRALTVRPLTEDEHEVFKEVMLGARLMRPYYARALAVLTPYAVDNLGTVAVGLGGLLYLDFAWIKSLSTREAAGVIACHEVEHILRDHSGRRQGRIGPIWNLAGDSEINDDQNPDDLPEGGIWPKHFGSQDGGLAEAYYEDLLDQAHKHAASCSGGSGAGAALPFEADMEGGLTLPELDAMRDGVAEDVANAVKTDPGKVPAGVRIWAEARVRRMQIDWRINFASTLARSRNKVVGADDYTWAVMSRRQQPDVMRPGVRGYLPKLSVIVDTSGSMADWGPDAASTVWSLASGGWDLEVIQVDHEVASITSGMPRVWEGGGGTDLRFGFAAATAKVVVVITDCETPWPDPPDPRTVIVVTRAGCSGPPWARTIIIPDKPGKK